MTTMTTSGAPDEQRRDAGITLVEIIVTIVMFTLVTGVIAAAVVVIFRTEEGVVVSTAEAQDTRQVVNYFPLDVGSGSLDPVDYRATIGGAGGDSGSGCAESGNENLLRIDVADDERIAYRLEVPDSRSSARIDRYVCNLTDTGWEEVVRVNIADSLDLPVEGAEPLHRAEVVVAEDAYRRVDTVRIDYVQRGRLETFHAAPRPENPYATTGLCDGQPLAAAANIASFVIGDVFLSGTTVKSALYVGGTLTFDGAVEVAQAQPQDADAPVPADLGLMATAINWGGSSGSVTVKPGFDVLIGNDHHVVPTLDELGNPTSEITIFESDAPGPPDRPRIIVQSTSQASVDDTRGPLPLEPGLSFYELTLCSERLAQLPRSCDRTCSFHSVIPNDFDGTASDEPIYLNLTDDSANVLNMEPSNLADLAGEQIDLPANVVSQDAPLIINVASEAGATVEFVPPTILGLGQSTVHVIWNFPSAAEVIIRAPAVGSVSLAGTVFAPYATVTSYTSIAGGVIARDFYMYGRDLSDERAFFATDGIFWG